MPTAPDLVVLFEHPEWQKPLFSALERRNVSFAPFDLKAAAFDPGALPAAKLFFNQASPSAYLRGHVRAVPLALAFLRALERRGARVLNGAGPFALELSKVTQAALLTELGIATPRTAAFNDVAAAKPFGERIGYPLLVKPEQGGSGARMFKLESHAELVTLLERDPSLWEPDHLLLLQELVPYDGDRGIVRMEFVGGKLLYAMRVVSHGAFNLCPSEVCNPTDGSEGHCAIPETKPVKPVEFFPYPEVPPAAVEAGLKIMRAGGLDIGGIEYLEAKDGRLVFYDVNANSNLRPAIAESFGFDPFERVVDFLVSEIAKAK